MRKLLTGIAVAGVALAISTFAFAQYVEPLASTEQPVFTIEHDIAIAASASEVWAVLTDFAAYPDWNPYVIFAEGELAMGETITITIVQENFPAPLTLHPEVARFKERRTLGWHGSVLFPGLHETDHYFEIDRLPDGRSRLHHAEEFRGWIPRLTHTEEMIAPTRTAFRLMNEALAKRVENLRGVK